MSTLPTPSETRTQRRMAEYVLSLCDREATTPERLARDLGVRWSHMRTMLDGPGLGTWTVADLERMAQRVGVLPHEILEQACA